MQIKIVETKINFGPWEGLEANLKFKWAYFRLGTTIQNPKTPKTLHLGKSS